MKYNSIIFVCLGNICRSPLAEGIAKKIAKDNNINIKIKSAGTSSWHTGEAPCINSQKIAKLNGIDISNYKAKQITKKDFEEFDLIVGLDSSNIDNLLKMGAPKEKLKKLGCFKQDCNDIPDPYYFDGFDGFDKVFNMIKGYVLEIFKD